MLFKSTSEILVLIIFEECVQLSEERNKAAKIDWLKTNGLVKKKKLKQIRIFTGNSWLIPISKHYLCLDPASKAETSSMECK